MACCLLAFDRGLGAWGISFGVNNVLCLFHLSTFGRVEIFNLNPKKVHTLQAWVMHDIGGPLRYMSLLGNRMFSGSLRNQSRKESTVTRRHWLRTDWLRKWMGPYPTFSPSRQPLKFISMVHIHLVHAFSSPTDLGDLRRTSASPLSPRSLRRACYLEETMTQEMLWGSCYFNTFFFLSQWLMLRFLRKWSETDYKQLIFPWIKLNWEEGDTWMFSGHLRCPKLIFLLSCLNI